jgi:redox-sensitive bicupin YhaK (pirin superfamily)
MSAGTGLRHSEFNASSTEPVHFLQMWIIPERQGLPPGYEQTSFPEAEKRNELRLIGSRDGRLGSVTIHQDVDLFATLLAKGESVAHTIAPGRGSWVQVARGSVALNGQALNTGDGVAITTSGQLHLEGLAEAEVLVFDLGP